LNIASTWLAEPMTSARCCLIRAPHTIRPPRSAIAQFVWPADRIITDHRHGFHIRCTAGAERDLHGWIRSSRRLRGPRVETGGLLFGQFDEFLKIAWVTEVSGPPPDSRASAEGFLCGVAGATEPSEEKRADTRLSEFHWHVAYASRQYPVAKLHRLLRDEQTPRKPQLHAAPFLDAHPRWAHGIPTV
jgi:hypothetical protein